MSRKKKVEVKKEEERSELYYEILRELEADPYAGEGVEMFDDWHELAPDFLDQCSVPDDSDDDEED